MNEEQDKTRGDRREEGRRKRHYGPKLHGKRLAELVRNALRKRLGKKAWATIRHSPVYGRAINEAGFRWECAHASHSVSGINVPLHGTVFSSLWSGPIRV